MTMNYIDIKDLEVYKLSRVLSQIGWKIFSELPWDLKKSIGFQFIESTDSVGANIAEGYGRYHYLDRVKFYYNARASLLEAKHWIELLEERNLVHEPDFTHTCTKTLLCLNMFIKITKEKRIS